MEQQAELVAPEAVAAESVGKAGAFEIVDPLLRLAPIDVPVVESQGRVGARGDHEARIGPLGQCLRLVDHPAHLLLATRLTAALRLLPPRLGPGPPTGIG